MHQINHIRAAILIDLSFKRPFSLSHQLENFNSDKKSYLLDIFLEILTHREFTRNVHCNQNKRFARRKHESTKINRMCVIGVSCWHHTPPLDSFHQWAHGRTKCGQSEASTVEIHCERMSQSSSWPSRRCMGSIEQNGVEKLKTKRTKLAQASVHVDCVLMLSFVSSFLIRLLIV